MNVVVRTIWSWLGYSNGLPLNRYDLEQWWAENWKRSEKLRMEQSQVLQTQLIAHLKNMLHEHHSRDEMILDIASKLMPSLNDSKEALRRANDLLTEHERMKNG